MKFLLSEKAVSEVVGYAIILGITITGVALIALVGIPSIYQLQDMTTVKDVEQAFTFSGTKASGTLIGDAPMHLAKINLGGGTVTVEPNGTGTSGIGSGSYITIKSRNNTFNITVPMGKVIYRYGDRIVGYEGGGIWSKYPSGSVMLSPPEFHYDGRTLILPILTVNGNATVGGKGTATVTFKKNSTIVLFPNTTYSNRTNPLNYSNTGIVYVNITSDFYDAWAEYAKSLSFTRVNTSPANRTTSIAFTVVPSTLGGNIVITNPISFIGVSGNDTPLDNFSFKISSAKNNLGWDIRAKSGTKTLIFYLKDDHDWDVGKTVTLQIGYQDSSVSSNHGETWLGNSIYTIQPDGFIYVDFLNKSINLTYKDINNVGANSANQCQTTADQISGIRNPADSWGNNPYINESNVNKSQSLYNITQHYFSKMALSGDISFYKCSDSNNNAPSSNSTMVMDYDASGTVTFLYASNNIADVNIN